MGFDLLRGAAGVCGGVPARLLHTLAGSLRRQVADLRAAHLVAHGAVPLFLFIAAYLQGTGPREGSPGTFAATGGRYNPVIAWSGATFAYRVVDEGLNAALWRDLALTNISGRFYFAWLLLAFGVLLSQGWRVPDRWLWPLAGDRLRRQLRNHRLVRTARRHLRALRYTLLPQPGVGLLPGGWLPPWTRACPNPPLRGPSRRSPS